MRRQTFSLLFLVKNTRPLKDGTLPILARITVNGERAEFVIQKSIEAENWDNVRGCAKGKAKSAREVNDYLDFVKSKLRDHKIYMEEHNEDLTAKGLRNKYMGIDDDSKRKSLIAIFDEHNEKCAGLVNKDFAPATLVRYKTSRKHLSEFIMQKYKKPDLDLNDITPMFISDFEYFLKTDKNCCNNSTIKHLKSLKKIVRIALANGWMKNDPFANKRFHLDNVDLAYLTTEELDKLINKEFKIDRLQLVKDIYLFCCFTGLAFIDVKNLTNDDIFEQNGKLWIKKKRQKTKNWCHIPLLTPALNLIEKYKNNVACKKGNFVLPVLSNQKMNAYLKEIADLSEINKNLSTHTARHTFATTVTLTNKISMEVVSKMLGHSSINMTKKYARVVDDLINLDMQKIYGKYDNVLAN